MNPVRTPEGEKLQTSSFSSPPTPEADLDLFWNEPYEEEREAVREAEDTQRPNLSQRLARLASTARRSMSHRLGVDKQRPWNRRTDYRSAEALKSRLLLSATPALIAAYEHVQTLEANPETVTETSVRDIELFFASLQNGLLAEQSVVTLNDEVRMQLWTSNNQGITVSGGVVSSGADGKDHIIKKFVDGPVLVSVVDMRNISGSTGGKINLSLGDTNKYFDLPASGDLVLSEPVLADTVSFIAQNGRGAGFEGVTIQKSVTETRETDAYLQELAEARALVATLEAEEGAAEATAPASITFAGLTAGNLDASLSSSGATVSLPVLGSMKVYSGGFTPMRVTETGGLKTGVNQGHMTLHFDTPTFVESITVNQSGSGVRKYNLGSGYQEMVGLTEIPVGKELSELTFIVYGDAEVEIVSINLTDAETSPENVFGPTHIPEGELALANIFATRAYAHLLQDNTGTTLRMHLRSAADATYVEADLGSVRSATISHAGGTTDTVFDTRFERQSNGSMSRFAIRLYTDASKQVLLQEIGGFYYPNSNQMFLDEQAPFASVGDRVSVPLDNAQGTAELRAWQRENGGVPSLTMLRQSNGVRSAGSGFSLDLSSSEELVTKVSFALATNGLPATAHFYRGDTCIGTQTVTDGTVEFHDDLGITSVVIGNPLDANGTSKTVSISHVSVTGLDGVTQVQADPVSFANNGDLARLAAPRLETTYLPNDFWATPLYYNPSQYNAYRIRNYSDGIEFLSIGYQEANGHWMHLPEELYTIVGNTIVVFPNGGGTQYLGLSARGGQRYSTYLPVGRNYDYDIEEVRGGTLEDVLPSSEPRINVQTVDLFDINCSMTLGWTSGMALEYSGESPVALGTLKVRARIENPTTEALGFTVTTYSGYPGVDGWDTPVSTTTGSIPANGLRTLAQEVPMRADDQGRGFVRYVVTLADGTVIGEGGRSVGAPRSGERRVAEQLADGTWVLKNVGANYAGKDITYGYDPKFVTWKQERIAAGDTWVAEAGMYEAARGAYEETVSTETTLHLHADKIVTPEGDVLSRMTRQSLTQIRSAAAQGLSSAILREHADHRAFFMQLLNAAEGLLALIPQGGDEPHVSGNAQAEAWVQLIELTTSDPHEGMTINGTKVHALVETGNDIYLGNIHDAKLPHFERAMQPGVSKTFTFRLEDTAMVNFWIQGAGARNLNLRVSGGAIGFGYPSQKSGMNGGESISLKLTPGEYTFTIEDKSPYGTFYMGSTVSPTNFTVKTGIEIVPFNSANIEGRISINGSPKVMPVSMRVAEFVVDQSGNLKRNTNYDGTEIGVKNVDQLNPNLPVWVVVHGRKDSEKGNNINELAQRLVESSNGRYQVVTIDWEDAAKDIAMPFGWDIADLENAMWTPAVGKWIGQQLLAAGFHASDIRFAAHSHGTFDAYFAAEWIKEETKGQLVGTIIAMDSAKNPVFFGANIPEERIQFKNVSQNSIGIHSSFLGSVKRAFGAHRSIGVSSPDTISPLTEHGYAVSLFSDALDDMRHGVNMNVSSIFALNDRGNIPVGFIPDKEGYDAWISVRSSKKVTETGDWWRAQASAIWYKKLDGSWDNPLFDPEIINSPDPFPEFPSSGEGTLIN